MKPDDGVSTSPGNAVDVMLIGHFAKGRNVVDGRGEMASGGGVYFGGVALRRLAAAITALKQEGPGPWHGTLADVDALLAGER